MYFNFIFHYFDIYKDNIVVNNKIRNSITQTFLLTFLVLEFFSTEESGSKVLFVILFSSEEKNFSVFFLTLPSISHEPNCAIFPLISVLAIYLIIVYFSSLSNLIFTVAFAKPNCPALPDASIV